LIFSYYLLGKPQGVLGRVLGHTQTVTSANLRRAIKTLGLFIMCKGEPSAAMTQSILERANLEWLDLRSEKRDCDNPTPHIQLSVLVEKYIHMKSFDAVAKHYGVHRPEVRRAISASKTLLNPEEGSLVVEQTDPEFHASGTYLDTLIDKVNPIGVVFMKRGGKKSGNLRRVDSAICGQFRINVEDANFDVMFVSKASF
jgi:hypothetical protein